MPKELMLHQEHGVLDGAIATLAPDLDILVRSQRSMHFATTHGERLQTTWDGAGT
jgi:hypothetical protein